MPAKDRSIGNQGLEQGGPNLGNDYSRNITREAQQNDTSDIPIEKNKSKDHKKAVEKEQHKKQSK
ncbi:MAG TPA: hypothetical protein VFS25_22435 [Chitinophaga sp.]|uniref:hypothetical protein n=1 Tax=Chitinophaga sp. TaxID=1869181 RepID=UPI002DBD293B|nr:hypothetical protein [Chitinophaga sp.]HEU4555621.1 hypothetical protein [Chitinophaga sp.]